MIYEQEENEPSPSLRRLNQHFFTDESAIEAMIAISEIEADDVVLEIGPGTGTLTERLARAARKVFAIEQDKRLRNALNERLAAYPDVKVIYGNALRVRLPKADRIVSNLPFNITEPFISRLFSEQFRTATLLVGKTYGQQATTTERPSSRISLLTRAYFETSYVRDVPSTCFLPEPSTDCSIITLQPLRKIDLEDDLRLYIIRCIWNQKTRPLIDALSSAVSQYICAKGGNASNPDSFLRQIQCGYRHSLDVRVDTLDNPGFLALYDALGKVNIKKAFNGHKPRGGSRNWRVEYAEHL